MTKKRISGFLQALLCTPAFVFLCAVFLCGALVGGLTGIAAQKEDDALKLAQLLEQAGGQFARGVLYAVLTMSLPLLCAQLRPPALFLSALCAARGFALSLTVSAAACAEGQIWRSMAVVGMPSVLAVPALLLACTIIWQAQDSRSPFLPEGARLPYLLCVAAAIIAALARAGLAALCA